VRLLTITEKQYEAMTVILGDLKDAEAPIDDLTVTVL
jgi:CRISPR/Cas system-associated protein endoribonuclease Cas2